MQNSPKKNSPESKKMVKPISYIWAFFHPVSRVELKKSLEEADEISKRVKATISESRKLHDRVDKALSIK